MTEATTITVEEVLGKQYDTLGHFLCPNTYTEIRNIREKRSIYVQSREDFIGEASKMVSNDLYVGINPRRTESGTSADVSHLSCVVLDIDPARERGAASTEVQWQSALTLGREIHSKYGGSGLVSSGSGCHVYIPIQPIQVENHAAITESVKAWMDRMRVKYETKELKIDAIHDLPRVIRIWGSHNSKSNRTCSPLAYPMGDRIQAKFSQVPKATSSESVSVPIDEKLNDRFKSTLRGSKQLGEILDGTRQFKSRSECDFAFIAILHRSGYSQAEIQALISFNERGKLFSVGNEDRGQDIRRVIEKVAGSDGGSRTAPITAEVKPRNLQNNSSEYLQSLDDRKPGISTGIMVLDRIISGLKPGKLYIFAARPGVGKTSLITQILAACAEQGTPCLYYPTECGAEPIWDKMVSAKTRVSLLKFQNGTFSESDRLKIIDSMSHLKTLPLSIVEDFAVTPDKVEKGILEHLPERPATFRGVVAVDFLQSCAWTNPDSVAEKTQAVYRFKKMAKDYNIPFILASQLNRGDGSADLRQLKGTGALEEFGDVISFIYSTSKDAYPVPTTLDVMKSKYSATGQIKMLFDKNCCRLELDPMGGEIE